MAACTQEDLTYANSVLEETADLSMRSSREFRQTSFPDGRLESIAEHSQMLAVVAVELALRFYPELDIGRVALLAMVHDFAELEADGGDTSTIGITDDGLAAKKAREAEGSVRLRDKYPFASNLLDLMDGYEPEGLGVDDEAAFVFVVDKIVPTILHTFNNSAVLRDVGLLTGEELWKSVEVTQRRLEPFRQRFPLLLALRELRLQHDADMLDSGQ